MNYTKMPTSNCFRDELLAVVSVINIGPENHVAKFLFILFILWQQLIGFLESGGMCFLRLIFPKEMYDLLA